MPGYLFEEVGQCRRNTMSDGIDGQLILYAK